MKLLFDQNVSPELVGLLADLFPQSSHVFWLNMAEAEDKDMVRFARENQYVIVTKDRDYLLHAQGPLKAKVIWLHTKNCAAAVVHHLLRRNAIVVQEFGTDPDVPLLPLP